MQRSRVRRTLYIGFAITLAGIWSGFGLISPVAVATAADKHFVQQFANPSPDARPKMRWWLPTTQLNDDKIRHEIKAMADAGIGSVEIQAYPVENGDTATHGWGTPEWNRRMQTALDAAKKHGLTVDLTLGPRYPNAVPSITKEDPAAAKELLYGKAVVAGGSTYSGAVPSLIEVPLDGLFGGPARQPGSPTLVAVTAARIAAGSSATDTPVKLDPTSLINITPIAKNGQLTWTAPVGGEWIVFSFWQRSTGQVVGGTHTPAYAVDHFSAAGTKAVTDYWERDLLTPEVRKLLKQTGGDFTEDSLELLSALHWTPGMRTEFQKSRGYDITPYLPVIFIPRLHDFMGVIGGVTVDSSPAFALADGQDSRIRNDYYQTLTNLYEKYHLDDLKKWSNKQGLQLRAQPAYGATLDLSSATTHVDVPETEQFHFKDTIDSYRAMAGAAHMSGKQVMSSEIAPVLTGTLQDGYGSSWKRMLEISNQNFAGGVNQVVWHGFPYEDGPGATWPGWSPFTVPFLPGFAEAWGPRQPTWAHMPDINGYVSRQQLVLQAGKPQVDLAIYRQSYWDGPTATTLYDDPGLGQAGYSYDFVSANLFSTKTAKVRDGSLVTDGPVYRALILNNQTILSVEAAQKILNYAESGLPVMIIGQLPQVTPFFDDSTRQDAELRKIVRKLLDRQNVTRIESAAELPGVLTQKNIQPAAQYANSPAGLLNVHRATKGTDYYYFFNNGNAAIDHEVSLEGKGIPYRMDAWTGKMTPLAGRAGPHGTKTIRLQLRPQDTMIIALTVSKDFAKFAEPQADSQTGQPQQLSSWHLSVEDWRPGATATETIKVNHELELNELKPWTEIPQLQDVSGVGRYTTNITWSKQQGGGAYLDLGTFFDTARVFANGQLANPVNLNNPKVHIGKYLKDGQNTITVEVATTLRNRLRTIHPGQAGTQRQPYGLVGPVRLVPYGGS